MNRNNRRSYLAYNASRILLPQLLAAVFACNLGARPQESAGGPSPVNVDDEGVFLISMAGRPVGSESFQIRSSRGRIEARGDIRLNIEKNGKTVSVESFPDLVTDSQLRPLTYAWRLHGPQSSRLEVDFRARPAKVRYHTINGSEDTREFDLLPDVMVLDDNVIHHFQLIAARLQALGGGKQTLSVFVPQEALPSLMTVEDLGTSAMQDSPAGSGLRHLLITTDVTHVDLWVDDKLHVQRVSVPAAQLEALRKK
ncbi:exported hypothetical protein [Acidobacteriia bacterium SbA2]|nr:exported hypothetical protein [Acidobacteriia bacterium SbA2]